MTSSSSSFFSSSSTTTESTSPDVVVRCAEEALSALSFEQPTSANQQDQRNDTNDDDDDDDDDENDPGSSSSSSSSLKQEVESATNKTNVSSSFLKKADDDDDKDDKNNQNAVDKGAYLRKVYGSDDVLFGHIEDQQGSLPFGNLLDAGTGLHSLRWMSTLTPPNKGLTHYTAITADHKMQQRVQREATALQIDTIGDVLIGNWFHPTKPLDFEPNSFDTILVDYLIGAMDGFSPYRQNDIIPKLMQYLKPETGRMYVVGLEPIPDSVPNDSAANIICRVRQVRDACILLAGHRCYREYPLEWIQTHIAQSVPEAEILHTSKYPILYRHATIVTQINVGKSKLPFIHPQSLREGMKQLLDELEEKSLRVTQQQPNGRIQLGFDYVVTLSKKSPATA